MAALLTRTPAPYATKHLQQGIESVHFRAKRLDVSVGVFRSFNTARRSICGFDAMQWLRKGFGFSGAWTVREQNQLLASRFGLLEANKA
jgi:transposase-like protein